MMRHLDRRAHPHATRPVIRPHWAPLPRQHRHRHRLPHHESRLEIRKSFLSKILVRILIGNIDKKNSLDPNPQIDSICSIRIPSRTRDIIE